MSPRSGISKAVTMAGCMLLSCGPQQGRTSEASQRFHDQIKPILTEYCYDCHGDGMSKGNVAFDQLGTDKEALARRELWAAVLKNVRAGLMPPEKKPRPTPAELERLEQWIKRDAFGIDPEQPDPGRGTLRRLNRVEYRNTIRDLMGIDFRTDEEFPPDDTGYGFDNIGDVLTLSPLLLEKYMQAAQTIVERAVPRVPKEPRQRFVEGAQFSADVGSARGSFYEAARLHNAVRIDAPGQYRLVLELSIRGEFDFDPGRSKVSLTVNDEVHFEREFGWHNNKRLEFVVEADWTRGEYRLVFSAEPLTPAEQRRNSLTLTLEGVRVIGPLDPSQWVMTRNYDRFFTRHEPPPEPAARRDHAEEVLRRFATRAFRRPVDEHTLARLVKIAVEAWEQPGKTFEDGVAQAMVAVLASPRFLFRVENTSPEAAGKPFGPVDEHALASRLSYFLWSTMPDAELFDLADRGHLRAQLKAQVDRMLEDPRSSALIENFTGQWLQLRDLDGININARSVLAREASPDPEEGRREGRRRRPRAELDGELRRAMRRESELLFEHVLRENKSVLELIDPGYTFLNDRLARHYGLPEVAGGEMRRVNLPADSPRGGLLAQGSVLIVTSNPTRTSPVKRGLFILDNILGTPPPPPPDTVPDLEESEKEFTDREPTLREVLSVHRSNALCSSCHNRMDPLGLALDNFNALGMWRDAERGQPIDAAGQLITGETFADVRELKRVLAGARRLDFYRCLTEKLMTFALGRGLEFSDVEALDIVVARLEKEEGAFSALLMGVIESVPFQQRRAAQSQLLGATKGKE